MGNNRWVSLKIKKIAICARISPQIVLYRLRYLVEKDRYKKYKDRKHLITPMRLQKFTNLLDNFINLRLRHRNLQYGYRKIIESLLHRDIIRTENDLQT
jgi:hypothetical protein